MKKEIIYKKLIRDKIPEICEADGWIPKTRILNEEKFIVELKKKILEEVKELNKGKTNEDLIDELADIQEIIDEILLLKKVKFSEFRKLQIRKRIKRGGFKKKLFLIKTRRENG